MLDEVIKYSHWQVAVSSTAAPKQMVAGTKAETRAPSKLLSSGSTTRTETFLAAPVVTEHLEA